jgi:hypothetical protein
MKPSRQVSRRRPQPHVPPALSQWREQFVLLARHVQRLQDASAPLVRRLPQLQADYDELRAEHRLLQDAYKHVQHIRRGKKAR